MKFYSEKTRKFYDEVKALEQEEKDFDKKLKELEDQKKAKEQKQEKLNAERQERAKQVEEAFETAKLAKIKANDLLNSFIEDYGKFNYSFRETSLAPINWLDETISLFSTLFL